MHCTSIRELELINDGVYNVHLLANRVDHPNRQIGCTGDGKSRKTCPSPHIKNIAPMGRQIKIKEQGV